MNIQLGKVWDSLHTSFWFVPTVMVLLAIGLAMTTIYFDETGKDWIGEFDFFYTRGPEGAREILSTIASSMMTVAVTAFSITIVALQLASSQFGPRLLRNFMRDTGNQIALGTFISTFIYCLLVLRTIRTQEEGADFVPHISVVCSVLLALASLAVLIFFIHHTADSIQAETVITEVGQDLDNCIERLFPSKIGQEKSNSQQHQSNIPANFDQETYPILSVKSGYLQAIDQDILMKMAVENNLLLRLQHRPGHFIVQKEPLLTVWPSSKVNKKLVKKLKAAFIIGKQRTQQQDVEFSVNQLVEIAIRALSPGINDTFTAIRCIDQLTANLSHLAEKNIPSGYRYDDKDKLRVIAEVVTFPDILDTAFNQIRQNSRSNVAVTIRLLEAIAIIAKHTYTQSDHDALLRHVKMIERGSQELFSETQDIQDIKSKYEAAMRAIKAHRSRNLQLV